jgi:hypothetical protein
MFIDSDGILEQSVGARNRVGTELSYRPPDYIGWQNRILGSLKVLNTVLVFTIALHFAYIFNLKTF